MPTAASSRSIDWLARAREVAPLVAQQALASERDGTLTDAAVAAMANAGLMGLAVPEALGGAEQGLETQLAVWEEVSRGDGSAGWCLMATGTASAFAGAFCAPEAAKEMFSSHRWVAHAGQFAPRGQGIAEGTGYQVTGDYSFGSGTSYASFISAGFIPLYAGQPRIEASGLPEMRVGMLPRDKVLFRGNWHVAGLQGTGSFDYGVQNQFVDAGYSFSLFDKEPLTGGDIYRAGIFPITAGGHAGWALGVGRHALDLITEHAKTKMRMGATAPVAENPRFQYELARAEAKLRSARAFVYEAFGDLEHSVLAGDEPSLEQRALVRTSTTYCTEIAAKVADFAYHFAGTDSLRQPSDLQRAWRDIHAGTQHIFVEAKTYTDSAQVFLGTSPEFVPL